MTFHSIQSRPFEGEADWQRVRRLLIETYPITGLEFNWEIRNWDGSRFHDDPDPLTAGKYARFRIWETADGKLAGLAHHAGESEIFVQIHPAYRVQIEEEMFIWCEEHFSGPADNGLHRRVELSVFEYDAPRIRLLEKRGYERTPYTWVTRRMFFAGQPLPVVNMAEGYTLRTTRPGDESDYQRIADVINAGFNRGDFHKAAEIRSFIERAPCFRHDLNLVAEAPDGSFGAHVGVTYDEDNRRGIFEPVCTAPDHRRKGLAQALMFEALHRLQALGAHEVTVATGSAEAANALYDSIGFTERYLGTIWQKTI